MNRRVEARTVENRGIDVADLECMVTAAAYRQSATVDMLRAVLRIADFS